MDTYQYKGRNKRGEVLQGTIESPNPQAVAQWLTDTGIFPITITAQTVEQKDPEWFARLMGEGKVSQVELLLFTRQIGNMVRAGLPMMESIEGIQKSTGSKALVKILQAVREDLDKGSVLSTAFSHHPDVFNEYYVSMVRVGEESGQLEESFQSLFKQIEFDREMRKKIKSALRYPSFVMIAIAIAISILMIFVIPVFAKVYDNMHVQLPLLTRILIGTSTFMVQFWWVIFLAVGLIYYVFHFWVTSQTGKYAWDKFKLKLPIIGKILVKATVARFCRSFATASKSGVPIMQAFQLVSRVVDNAFYEERILQMRKGVERGESLSRVASTAGIFAPMELQMIKVGEDTGEVDTMVEQIAVMYQDDVEYEVGKLSEAIEPLLLAVMGVLVGILLLGIFLPLWELGQATLHPGRP
jgi:MSHA biogenesis protein MshG